MTLSHACGHREPSSDRAVPGPSPRSPCSHGTAPSAPSPKAVEAFQYNNHRESQESETQTLSLPSPFRPAPSPDTDSDAHKPSDTGRSQWLWGHKGRHGGHQRHRCRGLGGASAGSQAARGREVKTSQNLVLGRHLLVKKKRHLGTHLNCSK